MIYASYSKLSKKLKNGIEISVGQAAFELGIKTFKMMFGSITQEPLCLLKFFNMKVFSQMYFVMNGPLITFDMLHYIRL